MRSSSDMSLSVQNLLLELSCTSASQRRCSSQAIQDLCIAMFVKMSVFILNYSGAQCLVLTACQISYVYVFIEVEGPV